MTSWWARWPLKSLASRLFTQRFIQAQIKENIKAPRHWPFWGEFTGDQWILRTEASNAENVSIWWRHHVATIVDLLSFGSLETHLMNLESIQSTFRSKNNFENDVCKMATTLFCSQYINSLGSEKSDFYLSVLFPNTCISIFLDSNMHSTQIAKFMGPTWGPPGSCRPQMGPMLAPWTLPSAGVSAWCREETRHHLSQS